MKKIALIALVASSLSANEAIFFKGGGKKLWDQQAFSPSYWTSHLQNKDLKFGYFENIISLLTCSKDKGTLELYIPNNQKQLVLSRKYSAFTGKASGDKRVEGDLKTPVGVYKLTEKKKNLDQFYGPMAFVTSYPNFYDKVRGKTGSGIWIHGLPFNGDRDPFTRGCIAIENKDISQLENILNYNNSLVLIDSNIKPNQASSTTYINILSQLYRWKYAWTYNHLDDYLAFYDSTFKNQSGSNLNNFKSYKKRIFDKNEEKTIDISNIRIIPYPGESANIFMVTFMQNYISDSHKSNKEKTLFLKLSQNQTISIIAED